MHLKVTLIFLVLCLSLTAYGQSDTNANLVVKTSSLPLITYNKGIGVVTPDSLFSLNVRFRMQNRISFDVADGSLEAVDARVRRLRLRLEGFVYSPKIGYLLQLGFSAQDMASAVGHAPNIICDAVISYRINPNFTVLFGQTKLPGNRQRINSSGALQLVDRSAFNGIFNLDRDFGLHFQYKNKIANQLVFLLKGAITTGEGRNWVYSSDAFLSYTGRFEVLPFGEFLNKGDCFEGDLAREKTPKLSVGIAYNYNNGAQRTAGQRGNLLFDTKNLSHQFVDLMFKYRGFALQSNAGLRNTANPVSVNPEDATDVRYVFKGHGFFVQSSYLFKSNYEFVGRYENIKADASIRDFAHNQNTYYTLGINKYLHGHRLKLQIDATYATELPFAATSTTGAWQYRFQIEIGI